MKIQLNCFHFPNSYGTVSQYTFVIYRWSYDWVIWTLDHKMYENNVNMFSYICTANKAFIMEREREKENFLSPRSEHLWMFTFLFLACFSKDSLSFMSLSPLLPLSSLLLLLLEGWGFLIRTHTAKFSHIASLHLISSPPRPHRLPSPPFHLCACTTGSSPLIRMHAQKHIYAHCKLIITHL